MGVVFTIAATNFWPDQAAVAGVVKFDDVEDKHLFEVVQSWRRPKTLVYQATKNPSFLKTTEY